MDRVVLDASAVLALLAEEPGADEVEALLDGSAMSAVNLAEVLQKSIQHHVETEGLEYTSWVWVEIYPFDVAQARRRRSGGARRGPGCRSEIGPASRSLPVSMWSPSRPIGTGPSSTSAFRSVDPMSGPTSDLLEALILPRIDRRQAALAGSMLWLLWKTFSGSYRRLISASRW